MGNYGLFPEGLIIPTLQNLRDDYDAEFRAEYGPNFPLGDGTFAGFLSGGLSERLLLVWEMLERVASSRDRDKATGIFLAATCQLTGTERNAAAPSTLSTLNGNPETLCGDPGTIIPHDYIVRTPDTLRQFLTDDDTTLIALAAWTAAVTYAKGDRVTNSARCYECIVAGVAAAPGPTTTSADFTDGGGVHWTYLGEGTAAADVDMHSADDGPVEAFSRGLTEIVTPVVGWNTAVNLLDATLGREEQTDEDLRITADIELELPGTGPAKAIRAELVKLVGVTSAIVFQNTGDVNDSDGRPPHSIEAMVQGGDDQPILELLLANVPAGIATFGNTSGTVVDDADVVQTFFFSRPVAKNLYLRITLTKDPNTYLGDTALKDALSLFGSKLAIGRDGVPSMITGAIFAADPGVLDVSQVLIYNDAIGAPTAWAPTTGYVATVGARSVVTNDGGRTYICITSGTSAGSGGPTGVGTDITDGTVHWRFIGANFVIGARELAILDTSRITILSSDGTP